MRTGRHTSLAATPTLVGAVVTLVTIVAVMLAYNANKGLPFVPSYNVTAEIPGGANLVEGNDVRVGGFRVGFVSKIRPGVERGGSNTAIALIDMKLDREIGSLPKDTGVYVRPRSNLGLKYVEITVGKSREDFRNGDTIPLANSRRPVEIDEFFSTFNRQMREDQQRALTGFGNALAGRGEDVNLAIEALVPFFRHLTPVMENLSDPRTRLDEFFVQSGRVVEQLAPVARTYASLFSNMATTFEALSRHEDRLREMIERGPPTLEQGIRSLPPQRPFLADAEQLFRALRPVADEFHATLPTVTDALRIGGPVLRRAPQLYENTEDVLAALVELVENPSTLLALKDLTTTVKVLAPLITYIAPYQTVCNYWMYFWGGAEHASEPIRFGTIQRVNLKSDNRTQDNRLSSSEADRPADLPDNVDPQGAKDPAGDPLVTLHRASYQPAIDAQGNADCQLGQTGYIDGPLVQGSPYPPSNDPALGGGSHVLLDSDYPGLAGPTFHGLKHLKDVP